MGAYFAFLPLLGDELGLDGVGGYLAAFALVVIGLRIAFARLPDQLGPARLSGTALVLSATGMVIAGLFPTEPGLWVATLVFATGVAFTFPAIVALAVLGVPADERGAVVGTTSLFLDVAFGLSPALLGLMAGATGYPRDVPRLRRRGGRGGHLAARPRARLGRIADGRGGVGCGHVDRTGLRRRGRPHGPRHRPGPRRDRQAGDLYEPDLARAEAGRARIAGNLDRAVAKGKLDAAGAGRDPRPDRGDRRTWRRSRDADLVVEAVFEDVDVKRALWRELDGLAPARRDLRLEHELDLDRPPRRGAVAPAADRAVRRDALLQPGAGHAARRADPRRRDRRRDRRRRSASLADDLGKQLIVSADRPGFIVNRILMPLLAEAMRTLEEGIGTADDIDTGAQVGLNHPMGPLELADFIGLDVCLGRHAGPPRRPRRRALPPAAGPRGARRRRPPRPEDRRAASTPTRGPEGRGRDRRRVRRRPDRRGAAAPRDRPRVRQREVVAPTADRARRGRALRPLALHPDGRAGADRRRRSPRPSAAPGFSYLGWTLVVEEIAAADMAIAVTLCVHVLHQYPVVTFGDGEQQARWLPADARRRGARCVRADRAGRGLGCRGAPDAGAGDGRRLRPMRRRAADTG